MASSSSTSSKQDLKVENTVEIKEEEKKKPIITPKQDSPHQDILSENTIPVCPNLGSPTVKIEKDHPPMDDKFILCMKCKKEFPTSHIPKTDPEVVLERQQKVIFMVNSREGGSSSNSPFPSFNGGSSSNSPFPSFNGGSSSNSDSPLFNGEAIITELKAAMFSSPIPYSSISWHPSPFPNSALTYDNHRVPFDSYRGLFFGPSYGGGGSSSTISQPLFGSGVTRGVSSMFSPPTPNRFFTGSSSYRTYTPKPIDFSSYIEGNNNKNSVGSWVSGEVPREMIDLNKPPCDVVDLEGDDDKGKAKVDLEGDVKGVGMKSWGTKKKRTR